MRAAFRPLRSEFVFAILELAVQRASAQRPERFRILQFSVQFDHLHLIVEAETQRALSAGMRGLSVRIARYVNDRLLRKGRFWADRWHGRELTSPRAVRNALVYVLMNFRKHAAQILPAGIDAFSSAAQFDGWATKGRVRRVVAYPAERAPPLAREPSVAAARSWLARIGWRKHGLLGFTEQPRRSH